MPLITILGAGPGISKAVAEHFGKEGFDVALIARSVDKLKQMTDELKARNINATFATADLADEAQLQQALTQIRDEKGHADVILYNAMAADQKDLLEQDWETFKHALDVNAGGAFHLLKTVLPYCLEQNKGKLFFTGGGLAFQGHPQVTTLSMGKAALRNLIQAAAKRVEGTNVHVAQVTVCGMVNEADEKYNPKAIAEQYWTLYRQQPGEFESEVVY